MSVKTPAPGCQSRLRLLDPLPDGRLPLLQTVVLSLHGVRHWVGSALPGIQVPVRAVVQVVAVPGEEGLLLLLLLILPLIFYYFYYYYYF